MEEDKQMLRLSGCVEEQRIPDEQEERLALLRIGASSSELIKWMRRMRPLLIVLGASSSCTGLLLGMVRARHPAKDAYGYLDFTKNKDWIIGCPSLMCVGILFLCLQQAIKGLALRKSLLIFTRMIPTDDDDEPVETVLAKAMTSDTLMMYENTDATNRLDSPPPPPSPIDKEAYV